MLPYTIKMWIEANPEKAESRSELYNWTCEQFDVQDESLADEIYRHIYRTHYHMMNAYTEYDSNLN